MCLFTSRCFSDPATFVHMSVSCSSLLFCKHWLFSPGKKVILDDVIKSFRPWNLHNLKSFLSNLHPRRRTLCLSHIYFPYIQFLVSFLCYLSKASMFTTKCAVNVVQLLWNKKDAKTGTKWEMSISKF